MVIYILAGIVCFVFALLMILCGLFGLISFSAGKSGNMSAWQKGCYNYMKELFTDGTLEEKYSKAEKLKMEGIYYIVLAFGWMIFFLIIASIYFRVVYFEALGIVIILSAFLFIILPGAITMPILKKFIYTKGSDEP